MASRDTGAVVSLSGSEEHEDERGLRPMLALVAALRVCRVPNGPRPEFRAALRQRLLANVVATEGISTSGVGHRVK